MISTNEICPHCGHTGIDIRYCAPDQPREMSCSGKHLHARCKTCLADLGKRETEDK